MEMFGVDVEQHGMVIRVKPVTELKGPDNINIPGDFSSAAYLLVAATIIPGSDLTLLNVGVNQTRTGLLDVLNSMGAKIKVFNRRLSGQEPVADIRVESAQLKGTVIGADIIPRLIDEIPILSVAALFASGQTVIRGAEELRVKETDRLRAMACELIRVGAVVTEKPDGMIIEGEAKLHFAKCETYADHRVAMSMSVVGLAAGGVHIDDPACIDISFPGFFEVVESCSVENNK